MQRIGGQNDIKKELEIDPTVKIVGVTKNRSFEEIGRILERGQKDLGENRVQELMAKAEHLPDWVSWHFIGHLQRNKVKYVVRMPQLALIHSVDSLRLARKISQEAGRVQRVIPVLLQVNIAREEQKYGFSRAGLLRELEELDKLENIDIRGLMTMAPLMQDPEDIRPFFAGLRGLAGEIKKEQWKRLKMEELSMGMSQDFKVAIEEGATIIRLGRILFSNKGGA